MWKDGSTLLDMSKGKIITMFPCSIMYHSCAQPPKSSLSWARIG